MGIRGARGHCLVLGPLRREAAPWAILRDRLGNRCRDVFGNRHLRLLDRGDVFCGHLYSTVEPQPDGTLALAQGVFSVREACIDGAGGSITVQIAIGKRKEGSEKLSSVLTARCYPRLAKNGTQAQRTLRFPNNVSTNPV